MLFVSGDTLFQVLEQGWKKVVSATRKCLLEYLLVWKNNPLDLTYFCTAKLGASLSFVGLNLNSQHYE